MSAVVFIPASLVHHIEQSQRVTVTGETLGAVIEQLEPDFPGIRKALCDDAGRLHRFLAVFVDGVNARTLQGLETPVGSESKIDIVTAFAGG